MIDEPDDSSDMLYWIKLMNKGHGYAGAFNYGSGKLDKRIVEMSTAREWCRSIAGEFGWQIGEPEHNQDDPPDCFISVSGRRLSVELVQLVENEHKARAAKGETPYGGQLFWDMQWSQERLASRLNEKVQKKGKKCQDQQCLLDVLVIHTAETWLTSGDVNEWLADMMIAAHPNISSVFLLMEYEPGRGIKHWPVFVLYGDAIGNSNDH